MLNGNKDQFLVFRDSHKCVDILDVIIPIETQIIKIRSDATVGSQMPKKRKLTVSSEIFPEKM